MDKSELHDRARRAFDGESTSQGEVARALDLNRSSVSRALRNVGLKHTAVQARIVSLLEGEPVERRSRYHGRTVEHRWIIDP